MQAAGFGTSLNDMMRDNREQILQNAGLRTRDSSTRATPDTSFEGGRGTRSTPAKNKASTSATPAARKASAAGKKMPAPIPEDDELDEDVDDAPEEEDFIQNGAAVAGPSTFSSMRPPASAYPSSSKSKYAQPPLSPGRSATVIDTVAPYEGQNGKNGTNVSHRAFTKLSNRYHPGSPMLPASIAPLPMATNPKAPSPRAPSSIIHASNTATADHPAGIHPHHQPTPEEIRLVEPWDLTVFLLTVPRYITRLIASINLKKVLLLSLLALLSVQYNIFNYIDIPVPDRMSAHWARMTKGARIIVGLPEYEQPPSGVEKDWIFFKHVRFFRSEEMPDYNVPELQWVININFLERIERIERKMEQLNTTLTAVQQTLPKSIVVDKVDGKLVIPDLFWSALQAQMQGDDSMWQAFFDSNRDKLRVIESEMVEEHFYNYQKDQSVISKGMLERLVREQEDRLVDTYSQSTARIRDESKAVAEEAAKDFLTKHLGSRQAGQEHILLSKSNLINNAVDEMNSVNFFSRSLGARVDPRHTSPTARVAQKSKLAQLWASWNQEPNEPGVALDKWQEAHDCWCAPESTEHGKAQLAVWTPMMVFPDEVVIEHVPSTGTLDIAAAPRDFEIWLAVNDEEAATRIGAVIDENINTWNFYHCGPSPGPNFVCVGTGKYDIHKDNWVQKFPIAINADEYGLASDHFVIRVTSNWGSSHTCLYRVRLNGSPLKLPTN